MKTKISFVLITRNKSKNDLCTLTMKIYYHRKHAFKDTGIELYQNQFDEKEAKKGFWKVVKNHPRLNEYNNRLKSMMDRAYFVDNELRMSNYPFSAKIIKEKMIHAQKPAYTVFTDIIEKDRRLGSKTKSNYFTVVSQLSSFAPSLTVKQIDYKFTKDFESWLLSRPSRRGGNIAVITANKYIRDLHNLLKRCLKYGLIDKNYLEGYDYIPERRHVYNDRTGKKVAYQGIENLKMEDIDKLESVDFNNYVSPAKAKSLRYTADALLWSCWTGQRLSDWIRMTPGNIKDGVLTFEPEKGKENRRKELIIKIPVAKIFDGKPLRIFKNNSRLRLGKPVFGDKARGTHQSNMVFIASLLFPGRKISLHSGRHTFQTLLQDLGMDIYSIKKLMGHSKIETTQKYNHSEWDKVNNDINDIFKKAQ